MNTLDIGLEVEPLLDILDKTIDEYMKAFEIAQESITLSRKIQKEYQAFEKITAFYMDSQDTCISFVTFSFDWQKYKMIYKSDDPDVIISREETLSMTPKKILEDACTVITKRVQAIKAERDFKYVKMVYTYTDEVWKNKELLAKIREEAHLGPFNINSIRYSDQLQGYQTTIKSSLSENTLAIDFVV